MRVVFLDVSFTWSEFPPVSLVDAPADAELQVHAVSQTHKILRMVRNTSLPTIATDLVGVSLVLRFICRS